MTSVSQAFTDMDGLIRQADDLVKIAKKLVSDHFQSDINFTLFVQRSEFPKTLELKVGKKVEKSQMSYREWVSCLVSPRKRVARCFMKNLRGRSANFYQFQR